MGGLSPQKLIEDSIELFSLPDIYFQISKMINDPMFSTKDIGEIINKDPALSIRLLKIVNSSLYGFSARIDRISRAVTIMGANELKHLVLATSVINKFDDIPIDLVDMTAFWFRSIQCGVITRALAIECSVLHHERLFLVGLLHDIGSLVFYHKLPEKALEVLLAADHNRMLVAGLEKEIIGFTHAEVGALLIRHWGLPASIFETINYYLKPELSQSYKLDTFLLNLASQLIDHQQQGIEIEGILNNFSTEALSFMRLTPNKINRAMEYAEQEYQQVFESTVPANKVH